MNPKTVGEISEGQVVAALLRLGKVVLTPFGDNQRYDLVVEEDGVFIRVQVKTGRLRNNTIQFNTSSTTYEKGWKDYRGSADVFGVYCHETDTVYIVPVLECGHREARLRLKPTKNGQKTNVRIASHYELSADTDLRAASSVG